MKKWSKVFGIAIAAALAMMCLAACGGGSSSAASASASASGSEASASSEPIYVVTKATMYSNMNGEVAKFSEYALEYDEHGNLLKQVLEATDPQTNEAKTTTSTWADFDEYGYPGTFDNGNGQVTKTEWTIEDGHAVKSTSDTYTAELSYYADGKLKSQVLDYGDNGKVMVSYDENGRQVSTVNEGGENPNTFEKTWILDDKGNVTGYTGVSKMEKSGMTSTTERTCECDANGNVIAVKDGDVTVVELEYQKIDNPSTWAWVKSFNPQFV